MDYNTGKQPRNFSIVVPHGLYTSLRKIMILNDGASLGGTCRHLLDLIPSQLYTKLHMLADREKVPITTMIRRFLEDGVTRLNNK